MRSAELMGALRSGVRAAIPHSEFRIPRSAVKHRRLFSAAGRREAKMPVRGYRGDAAARRARDEADLEQERLDDLFERAALLGK